MSQPSVRRRVLLGGLAVLALIAGAGTSPALARQADPLLARAQALHRKIIVIDAHADVPDDFGVGKHEAAIDGEGQVDLPKLKRGGFGGVVLAAFSPQGPNTPERIAAARALTDAKLKAIVGVGAAHPRDAELARTAADIRRIHAAGKVAIVPGFLNAYPFGDSLTPIDDYVRQGVRVFGLVHAGNNSYADSSRPGADGAPNGGLSPLGKQAVAKLNDLGVLIDVSQLTPAGLGQVLALSRAPVIASHSGLKAKVDATRNLSDAELDAIAAKGGVVQIVAFKTYLVPNPADYDTRVKAIRGRFGLAPDYQAVNDGAAALGPARAAEYAAAIAAVRRPVTVADLVDSVDYAVKRIGVDHVGISSDFNHGGGVVGFESEADAPNVTAELLRRGYSEADIGKIWGGNFLGVLEGARQAGRAASAD